MLYGPCDLLVVCKQVSISSLVFWVCFNSSSRILAIKDPVHANSEVTIAWETNPGILSRRFSCRIRAMAHSGVVLGKLYSRVSQSLPRWSQYTNRISLLYLNENSGAWICKYRSRGGSWTTRKSHRLQMANLKTLRITKFFLVPSNWSEAYSEFEARILAWTSDSAPDRLQQDGR